MRSDMKYVFAEVKESVSNKYPRAKDNQKIKNALASGDFELLDDSLSSKESISHCHKTSNIDYCVYDRSRPRLSVIKRFLTSKAGKDWKDICAEISKSINKKNYLQIEFWNCIDYYVEANTYLDNSGVVRFETAYKYQQDKNNIENCRRPFFVCPHTNNLKKTPKNNKNYNRRYYGPMFFIGNEYTQIFKMYKYFFLVQLRDIPEYYYKRYTPTEKRILEEKLEENQKNPMNLGSERSLVLPYIRDKQGRWIQEEYKDVAIDKINRYAKSHNMTIHKNPYWTKNPTYAYSIKQMNKIEIRRCGLRNSPEKIDTN